MERELITAYERGYSAGYQRAYYRLFVKPMTNFKPQWEEKYERIEEPPRYFGKDDLHHAGNAGGAEQNHSKHHHSPGNPGQQNKEKLP